MSIYDLFNKVSASLAIALYFGLAPFAVYGQQTAGTEAADTEGAKREVLEEIVVTARLRKERLQDIPLAISAFTAGEIENAGITDVADIAALTPGMQFNGEGGLGRVNSVVNLRGVNQGLAGADNEAAASVFVDGVYVLGTAVTLGMYDVERVEVIKGPQSAFFGRNTFAGAVNFITKTPDLHEFETQLNGLLAKYDHSDASLLTSGPIIPGKLAYQVGVRTYHKGGQWTATDGGALGDESSTSISGVLYAEPVERMMAKFRVSFQEDEDGPPIGGWLRGPYEDTCSGKSIERYDTAGNTATFYPTEYICGPVPGFGHVEPITGRTILSSSTITQPAYLYQDRVGINTITGEFLIGPQPNAVLDLLGGDAVSELVGHSMPKLDKLGLKREQMRVSLVTDYNFGTGYTATFLGGYNDSRLSRLYDLDSIDIEFSNGEFIGRQWYSNTGKYGVDWSVEGRLASPQDKKLRWLVGATYYDQDFINRSSFLANIWTTPDVGPLLIALPDSGNKAEVSGIFGSVSYDIKDDLTVDLETRYLVDERAVASGGQDFTTNYYQFTPRLIINYRPTENTTLYAQASRGVLPGTTNAIIATCSPDAFLVPFIDPFTGQPSTASECDQMRAQLPDGDFLPATESQELDAIEFGWKQRFLDGRLNTNLTVWKYKWKNRPFRFLLVFFRDAANPADRDGIPLDFPNNSSQSISGSQEFHGVEFESSARVTDHLTAQLNFSWTENEFIEFGNRDFERITGVVNYKGLAYGGYPEWMGNLNLTYDRPLNAEWGWFARSDFQYHGKYFAENLNLATVPDYLLTNIRLGLEREDLRLELFARNLFDTTDWLSASTGSDFTGRSLDFQTIRGILVRPQDKRTVGLRVSMSF